MLTRFAAVYAKRAVLWTLVRRDLQIRYAQSALGYVWTVLDPLLMSSVYFVVFTYVFKARDVGATPYFLYLVVGLLAWQWFSAAVTDCTQTLRQEARLVRSTNLPREIWVVRVVLAKGIEYALSLPVLIGFTLFYLVVGQAHVSWRLILFLPALVLQAALILGIGLMLAPLNVMFLDTQRLVRIALRFGFYMTPVLYSLNAVPEVLRPAMSLNPMSGVLELYRAGFFDVDVHWASVAWSVLIVALLLVAGSTIFRRMERAVLKEI